MLEKGKNEEAKVASTIASLKRILSVTDKIEQELQNMKSSIFLAHDDAPLAVDQNAVGILELPVSTALAADGSYVAAVAVPQHLHSMLQQHIFRYEIGRTPDLKAAVSLKTLIAHGN